MTSAEARDVVFTDFRTVWNDEGYATANIKWPNIRKDTFPVAGGISAKPRLIHLRSDQSTLPGGNTGKIKWKTAALLEVMLYLDKDDSNDDLYTLADLLIKKFRTSSTNNVWYRDPVVRELPEEGNFNKATFLCTIEYYHVDQPSTITVLTKPPVLYLPMDNYTERDYVFPNQKPDLIAGKKDSAFDFNGVDEVVEIAVEYPHEEFSLSVWVKGTDQGNHVLTEKGENNELMLQIGSSNNGFYYLDDSNPAPESFVVAAFDDTWHHVVATFNGTHKYLYLDGVRQHYAEMTAPPGNSAPLSLGGRFSESHYAPIALDDLAVFCTPLSPAEVLALYNSYS